MKSLLIAIVILSSTSSFAKSVDLNSPEAIYTELSNTFPEFADYIGGFSYEVNLKKLECASSNTNVAKTLCTATDLSGKQITKEASSLFLALLNAGVTIDRKSEAGTTYIDLKDMNCASIEAKTTTPDQANAPEYSCSIKN